MGGSDAPLLLARVPVYSYGDQDLAASNTHDESPASSSPSSLLFAAMGHRWLQYATQIQVRTSAKEGAKMEEDEVSAETEEIGISGERRGRALEQCMSIGAAGTPSIHVIAPQKESATPRDEPKIGGIH